MKGQELQQGWVVGKAGVPGTPLCRELVGQALWLQEAGPHPRGENMGLAATYFAVHFVA